jgi:tetratricopeptide (TPR) repeat protein
MILRELRITWLRIKILWYRFLKALNRITGWITGWIAAGPIRKTVRVLRKRIRIDPDDSQAYYKLGFFYIILGDKDSALSQYKILRELDENMAKELFDLIHNWPW